MLCFVRRASGYKREKIVEKMQGVRYKQELLFNLRLCNADHFSLLRRISEHDRCSGWAANLSALCRFAVLAGTEMVDKPGLKEDTSAFEGLILNQKEHLFDVFLLIRTDFHKVYDLYISSIHERNSALTMTTFTAILPFLCSFLLVVSHVIPLDDIVTFSKIPDFLFLLTLVSGILGIIPFTRLVDAHCRRLRNVRMINNFRRLYVEELRKFQVNWKPNIPWNPTYPPSISIVYWEVWYFLFIGILNSLYVYIGISGLDANVSTATQIISAVGVLAVHVYVLFTRDGLRDQLRYHEPPASLTSRQEDQS